MIHLVFQKSDVDALQQAFLLDAFMQGEVLLIADDYAVGPLVNIYSPDGIAERKQWWRDILAGGDYDGIADDGSVPDDHKTVASLKETLQNDPGETLWIWAAQNKHDVSGYYWLISQLQEFQGRVFILYLNNLPFINTKGHIFYPVNLFDIPPREFLKAKKLARPVTLSEFEIDPDEWQRICQENKGIRLLEGGKKLVQQDYDYYDVELRRQISGDWQKVHKIINGYLHKTANPTGDAYLLWRLKTMIGEGRLDVQGEVKKMKDFEIKLPAGRAQEAPVIS